MKKKIYVLLIISLAGNIINAVDTKDQVIEYYSYYIFNNLNLKWNYSNINDILENLNIYENYTIDKNQVKQYFHGGEGFFDLYSINSEKYKIEIYGFPYYPDIYWLFSIEIKLNNKNYLNIFPYKNKDEYVNDKHFGLISKYSEDKISYRIRENIIQYGGDDEFGYCDLIFYNGLLKSIKLYKYIS